MVGPQLYQARVSEPSEEVLVSLLRCEAEFRVSPEMQQAIEEAEGSGNTEGMNLIDSLQRRLDREYNTSNGGSIVCVNDLLLTALRHPDIALWVKFNCAKKGTLLSATQHPMCHSFVH